MNGLSASYHREITPLRSGCSRAFASALFAAGLVLAALPVQAAQTTPSGRPDTRAGQEKVTALAAKDPETTSSVQSSGEANCARTRQRLFVEGEGWIVRRVTTCY